MRSSIAVLLLCGCGRLGFEAATAGGDDAPPIDGSIEGGDAASEPDAPDGVPLVFGAAYTTLPATTPPSARRGTGAAVSPDQRIWVFGGFTGASGIQNQIYVFAPGTNAWSAVTPMTGTPATRERHAIGWDPVRDALVVFGGHGGFFPLFSHHDELYAYSPAINTWAQIPRAGAWPAPRKDVVMVWVPSLSRFLVYGGNDGPNANNRFSDLWTLSISNTGVATWTPLQPGGVAPPAQSAPCAGYDPATRRLIVFGGETQDSGAASTTYQYLVDTNTWQKDSPTGTVPSARAFSNCAWDPDAKRLVLYGGQDSSGAPIAGAFAYNPDAAKWETLATASGTPPGACSDGGAVFSPAHGATFVFGGRTSTITYTNASLKIDLVAQ